jgi:hexosaminidase
MNRVGSMVEATGKQMVGWEEITQAGIPGSSIVQHWNLGDGYALEASLQGLQIIMSPADKAYLDMKYTASTVLGLDWAGYITVPTGYSWDPAALVADVTDESILGVEAPLWSETLETIDDIEYMAFPRILGYAETGWTPQAARNWEGYRLRLAAQGPRLKALGVNFYRSPDVPWP